jgi:hypothetical protein
MKRSVKRVAPRAGDEMQHHLGIRGRLIDRAVRDQARRSVRPLVRLPLWQMAMPPVSSSANSGCTLRRIVLAGGRIARVSDGRLAGQALDHFALGEIVADKAEPALGMKALAVEGDDARRLLSTVLERVQAERGERRRVGMAPDAEHAAFLVQPVGLRIMAVHAVGLVQVRLVMADFQ